MTNFTLRAAPVNLTATQSLIVVSAGTDRPVVMNEFTVSFDGVDSTKVPCEIQIVRCSAAGTGTTLTPLSWDQVDGTAVAATALEILTVEPTVTAVLKSFYVPVYQSTLIYVPPSIFRAAGTGIFGIRAYFAVAPTAVNAVATMLCTE